MIFNRPNTAFVHDVIAAALAFILSLLLRLGDGIAFYPDQELYFATAVFTIVAAIVFRAFRMYQGVWRYASLNDLVNITKAVSLTVLIFLVILFTVTRLEDLPRSLPFISWFVLIALLGGPRFAYRLIKDRRLDLTLDKDAHLRVPILLVGAGDSAELFIRDVSRTDSNYRVVGIVSGSSVRVGQNIHGVKILGTLEAIGEIVEELTRRGKRPQRVVVTSERFETGRMQELFDISENLGISVARLPSLSDFKNDMTGDMAVRPIEVEDLLGRPQANLEKEDVRRLISNRRVLVTGAGGSIGSELVRQLANLKPAHLTLLDNSEYNLFRIDLEVGNRFPDITKSTIIADVRDSSKLEEIFRFENPEIVFHAAALKHVPLVEVNVLEGVATNVFGTINVANATLNSRADTFVQISTDKAVNPTNVMGSTKRLAELYCQTLGMAKGTSKDTTFVTVRFGNVLGSTGSVVEIFRNQLAQGGPLTVTHPDMTRYFMTIRESVELVLQASALGNEERRRDGKIFVLDMGEPVKIMDLARQMIRLAGLKPEEDVKIEVTGIRPGEKLFEEIFHGAEAPMPTTKDGVMIAAPRAATMDQIKPVFDRLATCIETSDTNGALKAIRQLVPEFQSGLTEEPTRGVAK